MQHKLVLRQDASGSSSYEYRGSRFISGIVVNRLTLMSRWPCLYSVMLPIRLVLDVTLTDSVVLNNWTQRSSRILLAQNMTLNSVLAGGNLGSNIQR